MTLIKWKPIKPMINMFDDFDSIFDNIFRGCPVNSTNHWNPAFSIRESNEHFIFIHCGNIGGLPNSREGIEFYMFNKILVQQNNMDIKELVEAMHDTDSTGF